MSREKTAGVPSEMIGIAKDGETTVVTTAPEMITVTAEEETTTMTMTMTMTTITTTTIITTTITTRPVTVAGHRS
jgi:hypothetical protein